MVGATMIAMGNENEEFLKCLCLHAEMEWCKLSVVEDDKSDQV